MSNIAVVGAGGWGRNLIRNFHALGALGLICDSDPEMLGAMASAYPEVPTTADYADALNHPGLEAIAIATPAFTHYELARQALQLSDKHLFIEKPFVMQIEEGEELIRLAEGKRRLLMVGHVLQYHPAVCKLQSMIDEGALGKIHYVYSTRTNMGRIRTEENILWSFAPHDISAILMLLGEAPVSVRTSGGNHLRTDVADVTMTVMDFASGVQGHVFVSWLHPFKEQKLVVVGDSKMAVFDGRAGGTLELFAHEVAWQGVQAVTSMAAGKSIEIDSTEPLRLECLHFLDRIRDQASPKTDGHEGLGVVRVLAACQRSLEHNGERVVLDDNRGSGSNGPVADLHPSVFRHETAVIDGGARIGANTKVWHFSHILRDTVIGPDCTIGQNVMIGPCVNVGRRCKIQNNVSVYRGVTLEDDVFCGPSVVFTNVRNPRSAIPRMDELASTLVREGATLGANATIVCGVEIGRYAFVGAGAVVTRSLPDHALALGNPARVVGFICRCGERLDTSLACVACGQRYREAGETIVALGPAEVS